MRAFDVLRADLELVWAADTAADPSVWTPERPSMGQCAITAMVVAEFTDATTILRVPIEGNSHYFNLRPDGTDVDLTRDQFDDYEPLGPPEERTLEYLLSNEGTRGRWATLRTRLNDHWADKISVSRTDLRDVLREVMAWVPMGWDGTLRPGSLAAQERLYTELNRYG